MFFVAAVISTERNRQYYIQSDLRISALNSAHLRWHIPAPHRQPQSSALHSAGSDGKQPGSRRCSERGAAEPRAGGAAAPSAGALLSVPAAVRGAVERTISAGRPALGGRTGAEQGRLRSSDQHHKQKRSLAQSSVMKQFEHWALKHTSNDMFLSAP